ncbi:beta-1,3-galactosyltransferase 1 [Hydra vulgaris]|uniref:beta-1,3-galactosyltransferase 1 n=1 Tax=Hydra vulgaris TaxID=6087 RepID=UPI0002B41195|nr:beta-1,3-galactosyltransferase 1 [Hydra vulgaris]
MHCSRFYLKNIAYMFLLLLIIGIFTFVVQFNKELKERLNYDDIASINISEFMSQQFLKKETEKPFTLSSDNYELLLKESAAREAQALSHINFDTVEKDGKALHTVVILISSFVDHKYRRDKIRESWGNPKMWVTKDKFMIVFVTGKVKHAKSMIELAEEAKVSKDIMSLDIPEDFYLLAKKVIIGFVWAKNNLKFKAILKGDDDTFINIDNAVNFINQNKETYGYFGQSMAGQPVERYGRYKLTKEEHEKDHYDPYCSGGGFIFTNASIYKILPLFDLEKILRIDDAHIGEVAFKAGVVAKMTDGFYMWNRWCEYRKDVIVSHPAKEPECTDFLLKRSMIDNGKLPRDPIIEKEKYYKDASLLS